MVGVTDTDELVDFVPPDYSSRELGRAHAELERVRSESKKAISEAQAELDRMAAIAATLRAEIDGLRSTKWTMLDSIQEPLTMAQMERWLIEATLIRNGSKIAEGARALGIGERTLRQKLRQYGYGPRAKLHLAKG